MLCNTVKVVKANPISELKVLRFKEIGFVASTFAEGELLNNLQPKDLILIKSEFSCTNCNGHYYLQFYENIFPFVAL